MWTQYARVRANTLPPLWKKFLLSIGCEECCGEPLLMELINESILKERFLKVKGRKVTQFVECLNKMQHMELNTNTPTTSFLAYTQEWI